ncbi:MAG: hypothetical protein L6Q97_05255, partial [Thermoanaerobaculia bacterium]|nr:hypothetical protein [Thermoanaerobaculia bacterium]
MVRTFAPDCTEDQAGALSLRIDVLEALCRGFLENTAGFLTPAERENLPLGAQWIIGEQALRFLTDYLAGDTYYKTQYPEHNLVRARNQLALYHAVSENLAILTEFFTTEARRHGDGNFVKKRQDRQDMQDREKCS